MNVNTKPDAVNSISVPCPYFLEFQKTDRANAAIIKSLADHEEVVPTTCNVNVRYGKSSSDYICPDKTTNKAWRLAIQYANMHLSYMKATIKLPDEEYVYNMSSSAGIIGKICGVPKTKEYIQTELFDTYCEDTNHIPIQLVQTKDEFLSPEDLARNKIRFVDCVDKSFLHKQKTLFDNQNSNLKKHHENNWIKYGFVKQYGGFNKMVCQFEKCSLISFSDCSGYDTSCILDEPYNHRVNHLQVPKDINKEWFTTLLTYVIFYTLNPCRLYPNGQILFFKKSNSSGQNNTAADNCIYHEDIIWYLLITLWFFIYGTYPEYNDILNNSVVSIYSDDKALGLYGRLSLDGEDFARIEREVYAEFGMVIKESASRVVVRNPDTIMKDGDFEFLGSYNYYDVKTDQHYPMPRSRKLCTSLTKVLTCTKDVLSPSDQFMKIKQIEGLMEFTPEKSAVSKFLEFLVSSYPEIDPNVLDDRLSDVSNKTLGSTEHYLWTGFE
jgi:hypothetical protein